MTIADKITEDAQKNMHDLVDKLSQSFYTVNVENRNNVLWYTIHTGFLFGANKEDDIKEWLAKQDPNLVIVVNTNVWQSVYEVHEQLYLLMLIRFNNGSDPSI